VGNRIARASAFAGRKAAFFMSATINTRQVTAASSIPETLQYREYKLLLKSDHFTKPSHFHEFWKIARRVAKKLDIVIRKRGKPMETHLREVLFFDTPRFRLYNNGFMLRRRMFYKKGLPQSNYELTLKFRHPDRAIAAAVDVRPLLPSPHAIKFKEEILLPRDGQPGMRTIYAHSCDLDTPNSIMTQSFESISQVFPALLKTGAKPQTLLSIVNRAAIEEILVNLGEIDFGGKVTAKATLAIWRNRATQAQLVGEYSYQIKFDGPDGLRGKPKELSEAFFTELQVAAQDWIHLGSTKTALVYSLGGGALLRNHE
jgi:hypothetical protein